MPISDFLNHLQKNRRYSVHTVTAYKNDLLQLEQYLSEYYETTVLKANANMLRSWVISMLENGVQPKSINRKISGIKSFYNYLLKEEKIAILPTLKMVSPKVGKPLPAYIKQSEMDNLLNDFRFEDTFEGRRDELILEMFYSCGLRLSELISLQDASFDSYKSSLKVLGKRNKERVIPLHRVLVNKLVPYIQEKNEQFTTPSLFITSRGNKLYPKFVYRKVNYYLGQVTTSGKKSPHVLRHTFATHMLNNGADLNTIKEILGHANLSATEVYTHNSIEKLKNIYNQAHPRA